MILPFSKSPRSVMRTTTERPFFKFTTLTREPNGNVG